MSIAAVITDVIRNPDRTATLLLGELKPGEPRGQNQLTVLDPPPLLEEAVGVAISGGDSVIRVGDMPWADRVGWTAIRLRKPTKIPSVKPKVEP